MAKSVEAEAPALIIEAHLTSAEWKHSSRQLAF